MSLDNVIMLLKNVEATGTGAKQYSNYNAPYTVQVVFTNTGGSVTALSVQLEGSLDGVNYVSLHDNGTAYAFTAGDLSAKHAMYHIANKQVNFIRGNITILTETGTTAVSMYVMGGN